MKKTKIICTVGPASFSKQTIGKMFQAGMNGVRINTAYGNLAQYQSVIETVREIAEIPIIIDIKGPEIRIKTSQRKIFSKGDILEARARCSNDTLSGNDFTNNGWSIYSDYSSSNTLSGNNFVNNTIGMDFDSSSNNTIYNNNFINNTYAQVYSSDSTNVWDNGSVGNYWSDYLTKYPNATETDGVWNTPYVIDANNTDYYPLAFPIAVVPEFPSFLILPLFLIATLLAVIVYRKKGEKTSQS